MSLPVCSQMPVPAMSPSRAVGITFSHVPLWTPALAPQSISLAQMTGCIHSSSFWQNGCWEFFPNHTHSTSPVLTGGDASGPCLGHAAHPTAFPTLKDGAFARGSSLPSQRPLCSLWKSLPLSPSIKNSQRKNSICLRQKKSYERMIHWLASPSLT